MNKIFITIVLLLTITSAEDLERKYEIYSEYLGIKTLNLNKEQLKKIVPKLENKMKKDNNYKKLLLQSKLAKLNNAIKPLEQTICFSKDLCSGLSYATLGENVNLCSGKCNGKTLSQMNKNGWELIQVVTGLQSSFGMIFTRK